jgi:hypothetical protein
MLALVCENGSIPDFLEDVDNVREKFSTDLHRRTSENSENNDESRN